MEIGSASIIFGARQAPEVQAVQTRLDDARRSLDQYDAALRGTATVQENLLGPYAASRIRERQWEQAASKLMPYSLGALAAAAGGAYALVRVFPLHGLAVASTTAAVLVVGGIVRAIIAGRMCRRGTAAEMRSAVVSSHDHVQRQVAELQVQRDRVLQEAGWELMRQQILAEASDRRPLKPPGTVSLQPDVVNMGGVMIPRRTAQGGAA